MTKNSSLEPNAADLNNLKLAEIDDKNSVFEQQPSNDADDEEIDILGSGALMKKTLKKGIPGTRPERNFVCQINLEGRLENGTIVEKHDNLLIQLGDFEVVQGIDMVIPLMDISEVAEVKCQARFAYGEIGYENVKEPEKSVPPNATLIYIVELVVCKPCGDIEEMDLRTRKKIGNKKRLRGNFWFERSDYQLAIQCYKKALEYYDGFVTEEWDEMDGDNPKQPALLQQPSDAEMMEDHVKVHNNLAMAHMKVSAWNEALKSVDEVLTCQPENVKALFRKAKIVEAKGDVNAGIVLLQTALALETENKAIQNEISRMMLKSKREAGIEKDLFLKMVGKA